MWKGSGVSVATVLQVFLLWLSSWLAAGAGFSSVSISSVFTMPKSHPFNFRFHSVQSSGPLSFGIFESLFKGVGMVIPNILSGKNVLAVGGRRGEP